MFYSVSIARHSVSTPRLWPSQTVFFFSAVFFLSLICSDSKAALFGTPSQYPRAGTPSQYCAPAARRSTPGERRRKSGKAEDEQDLACPRLAGAHEHFRSPSSTLLYSILLYSTLRPSQIPLDLSDFL